MSFIQVEFLVFLAVVFGLYWSVRDRRLQNAVLLVSSALFYGWVHPWFLYLLGFSTVLDYAVGLGMAGWPARKRLLLVASMVGNLGLLGVFKYLDFFIDNVAAALSSLGVHQSVHTLGIYLPVGISFYTFQTMSYTFDVYRGKVEARRNFLDYATFVSLFPQLVAGPVERARSLLPQVEAPRTWSTARLRSGIGLALWGAVKKVVIADTVSMYVDKVFGMDDPTAALVAAATVGFAVQILADFSGYTDIARGTARMLGFELMENFRHPYLARSPSDFWRRWHVSFSSWIHDYVYVSFGGSRHGELRRTGATYGALLLSGLWHGASWNFVLWGAYHASLLTGWRVAGRAVPTRLKAAPWASFFTVPFMFLLTCLGWLVFRERHLDRLWLYLSLPWTAGDEAHRIVALAVATVVGAGGGVLALALLIETTLLARLRGWAGWPRVEPALWTLAAIAIFVFSRDTVDEFIYFQF